MQWHPGKHRTGPTVRKHAQDAVGAGALASLQRGTSLSSRPRNRWSINLTQNIVFSLRIVHLRTAQVSYHKMMLPLLYESTYIIYINRTPCEPAGQHTALGGQRPSFPLDVYVIAKVINDPVTQILEFSNCFQRSTSETERHSIGFGTCLKIYPLTFTNIVFESMTHHITFA